ncbi:MAG: LrgB family protein [Spirochaetaceae bacterium]|jgi:putative effector of murein hydrolase|nr:LrgB family protein [Spirochaetaceae bacterium]
MNSLREVLEVTSGLPAAGIILSIAAYGFGVFVCRKYRLNFVNPLLIGIVIVCAVIALTPLSVEKYNAGGAMLVFFILPATTVLAINVYNQREVMRQNFIPLLAGCTAGSIASIASIKLLCRVLSLDAAILNSLLPKSVTTAIALELAAKNGGILSITVIAITITGLSTSILGPVLIKRLGLKDRVAAGCAMGMAGHAIGTARALQIGPVEGGMAGISLCLAGIITSILLSV